MQAAATAGACPAEAPGPHAAGRTSTAPSHIRCVAPAKAAATAPPSRAACYEPATGTASHAIARSLCASDDAPGVTPPVLRQVAVKRLRGFDTAVGDPEDGPMPSPSHSPIFRQFFEREIEILATIRCAVWAGLAAWTPRCTVRAGACAMLCSMPGSAWRHATRSAAAAGPGGCVCAGLPAALNPLPASHHVACSTRAEATTMPHLYPCSGSPSIPNGPLPRLANKPNCRRHPNVVTFIGACHTPPNVCLVTEFCARGSLDHLLHKSGIQVRPCVCWHAPAALLRRTCLRARVDARAPSAEHG